MSGNNLSLYQLTEFAKEITDLQTREDLTNEEKNELMQSEIQNQIAVKEKLNSLLWVMDNKLKKAIQIEERAKIVASWAVSELKQVNNIKEYIKICMINQSIKEIEGDDFKIILKNNPPAIEILDETIIPSEFKIIKQQTVIDKNAIKEQLKDRINVPGAVLIQSQRIEIK